MGLLVEKKALITQSGARCYIAVLGDGNEQQLADQASNQASRPRT